MTDQTQPPPPPLPPPTPPPITYDDFLCECNPGFFDPIIYEDTTTKLLCEPCPEGTTCNSSGTTVHTLVIHPGHFRISNTTADVRVCPDHTTVTTFLNRPSGCAGSDASTQTQCRARLGGVYCRACSAEYAQDHYYHAAERECLECVQSMPRGVWVLLALLGCAAMALLVRQFARGRVLLVLNKTFEYVNLLSSSSLVASLMVTVKTLIGFFQIVTEVEEVFIMELPVKAVRFIKSFSWLDLSVSDLIQLECVGLGGYLNELKLTAAVPPLILFFLAAYALINEAVAEKKRGWKLAQGTSLRFLPSALFVTFLVVPDVSSLAFRSFRCECFGDESWLRADYSLQCSTGGCATEHFTDEYIRTRRTAWAVLWVYALGVPCGYALLLFYKRRAIMEQVCTPLADALAFLHSDFKPSCYWWELINLAQKLFVVGFATLIMPGNMMQLVIVKLVMVVFLLLLVVVKPYKVRAVGILALVEQIALLYFFAVCFIVKAEQLAMQVSAQFMTKEVHTAFFYNTEAISMTMLTTLVAAVTSAALVSIHQTVPAVLEFWEEALAFGLVDETEDRRTASEVRVAKRARAREGLRTVLNQRASTLEVPQFLYSEEAVTNPVQRQRLAEANARVRLEAMRASRDLGGSKRKRPKRREGALRRLGFNLEDKKETQTNESRTRALHLQLKRHFGVHGLVEEDHAPAEVLRVRRRLRAASRKAPNTDAREQHQLQQLALFRDRLESKGWSGAEKLSPRTRWDLAMHRYKQQRGSAALDGDEDLLRMSDGAPATAAVDGLSLEARPSVESVPRAKVMPKDASLQTMASGPGPSSLQMSAQGKASAAGNGSCGCSAQQRRRPLHHGSVEQKFSGSLVDMSQHLGDTQGRTEVEAAAAMAAMSKRKRRLSLTAGDDEWENMVVKDRPRRETKTGRERDHCALASVRGRGGCSAERSMQERSRREGSLSERASPARLETGTRVQHDKHGTGVVAEVMGDGRTRVDFDSGESHRYHPRALYKLVRCNDPHDQAAPDTHLRPAVVQAAGAASSSQPQAGTSSSHAQF